MAKRDVVWGKSGKKGESMSILIRINNLFRVINQIIYARAMIIFPRRPPCNFFYLFKSR